MAAHRNPAAVSPIFDLARHGDSIAIVDEAGARLTYAELAAAADDLPDFLAGARKLVIVQLANRLAAVLAYIGAMRAGHAVILLPDDLPPAQLSHFVDLYAPACGYLTDGGWTEFAAVSAPPALHPELCLLLSTSGSTGSPKLVRLSCEAITANARSICEYLGIGPEDRAITSLPLSYSYGLSVLHSHLLAGGSLLLTDRSVVEPEFWTFFRGEDATGIAGVPYSYELFETIGLRGDPPPSLRTLTQAGGRLAPELLRTYALWAKENGLRFYSMYGQTEASPRMSYVPPDMAADNPDCIGVAIPGGSFRLEDEHGAEIMRPGVRGELVYSGPNVMLGYALSAEDLARGREVEELRTGDLASRTAEGLYRIEGRASRFLKIAGVRIGLDDVEGMAAEYGARIAAGGSDACLALCVEEGEPESLRRWVAERCGLPPHAVVAFAGPAPRLGSGKVDYAGIRRKGEALAAQEAEAAQESGAPVRAIFARALGREIRDDNASFAALGGDSLSYVNASIGLQTLFPTLPDGWEDLTIAELEALRAAPVPKARGAWAGLDSEVLARVFALLLVIIGHGAPAQTEWLRGGASILFALAGYNLARFQQRRLVTGDNLLVVSDSFWRLLVPYFVLMVPMLLASKADRSIGWFFTVSTFTVDYRGPLFAFWFIESVFHALLIVTLLFLLPAVRRMSVARPFLLAMLLVGAGAVVKFAVPLFWSDGKPIHLSVDQWLYLYMLGWALFTARTTGQKVVVFVLAVALCYADWGLMSSRAFWPSLAFAFLLVVPQVSLPRPVTWGALMIAQASYFVYLAHVLGNHFLIVGHPVTPYPFWNSVILVSVSVGVGVAYAWSWRQMVLPVERRVEANVTRLLAKWR